MYLGREFPLVASVQVRMIMMRYIIRLVRVYLLAIAASLGMKYIGLRLGLKRVKLFLYPL